MMDAQNWVYKTLKVDVHGWFSPKVDVRGIDERLNELGGEGWELVTAFDTNFAQGASREIVLFFKRPVR